MAQILSSFSVVVDAHTEKRHDGTILQWPAAILNNVHPGDVVLGNIGQFLTYSADTPDQLSTITITFGDTPPDYGSGGTIALPAPTAGTSGTNTINGKTYNYAGVYTVVPHAYADLHDEELNEVEIIAAIHDQLDPHSGQYKVIPHAGSAPIYGDDIVPGSVGLYHQSSSHIARGHFTGAQFHFPWYISSGMVALPTPNVAGSEILYFVTDDGTGDGIHVGQYRIAGPIQAGSHYVPSPDHTSLGPGKQLILPFATYTNGLGQAASIMPSSTPGGAIVTFTRLFPQPVPYVSQSGAGQYFVRYCYTKMWPTDEYGANQTGAKLIESALSPIIYSGGGATGNAFLTGSTSTIVIPPAPYGYTGFNIYASTINDQEVYQYGVAPPAAFGSQNYTLSQITNPNDATYGQWVGGWVVTFSTIDSDTTGSIGRATPSYGFFAWPSGTKVTGPLAEDIMKIGHFSPSPDKKGAYTFHHYHPNASKAHSATIEYQSIVTDHLAASGTWSNGYALGQDGSGGLKWVQIVGGSGTGMVNPMGTIGDMIFGGVVTAGVAAAQAIGYPGAATTPHQGAILYAGYDASTPAHPRPQWLSPSNTDANKVLVTGGFDVAPSWQFITAGNLANPTGLSPAATPTNLYELNFDGTTIAWRQIAANLPVATTTTSGDVLLETAAPTPHAILRETYAAQVSGSFPVTNTAGTGISFVTTQALGTVLLSNGVGVVPSFGFLTNLSIDPNAAISLSKLAITGSGGSSPTNITAITYDGTTVVYRPVLTKSIYTNNPAGTILATNVATTDTVAILTPSTGSGGRVLMEQGPGTVPQYAQIVDASIAAAAGINLTKLSSSGAPTSTAIKQSAITYDGATLALRRVVSLTEMTGQLGSAAGTFLVVNVGGTDLAPVNIPNNSLGYVLTSNNTGAMPSWAPVPPPLAATTTVLGGVLLETASATPHAILRETYNAQLVGSVFVTNTGQTDIAVINPGALGTVFVSNGVGSIPSFGTITDSAIAANAGINISKISTSGVPTSTSVKKSGLTYDGTTLSWQRVISLAELTGGAGAGAGTFLVVNAAGTDAVPINIPASSLGYVLTSNNVGATPSWAPVPPPAVATTSTAGGILLETASTTPHAILRETYTALAAGSLLATNATATDVAPVTTGAAGTVLVSNGPGTAPSFGTITDLSINSLAAISITKIAKSTNTGRTASKMDALGFDGTNTLWTRFLSLNELLAGGAGAIIVGNNNGTDAVSLPSGALGFVLTSNGAGSQPTWAAPAPGPVATTTTPGSVLLQNTGGSTPHAILRETYTAQAQGAILAANAGAPSPTDIVAINPGATATVLLSNGPGGVPSFGTIVDASINVNAAISVSKLLKPSPAGLSASKMDAISYDGTTIAWARMISLGELQAGGGGSILMVNAGGTDSQALVPGTAGRVLTTNGPSAIPTWSLLVPAAFTATVAPSNSVPQWSGSAWGWTTPLTNPMSSAFTVNAATQLNGTLGVTGIITATNVASNFQDISVQRNAWTGTIFFGSNQLSRIDGPNETGAFRFHSDAGGGPTGGFSQYDIEAFNLPRRFTYTGTPPSATVTWLASTVNTVLVSGAANTAAVWSSLQPQFMQNFSSGNNGRVPSQLNSTSWSWITPVSDPYTPPNPYPNPGGTPNTFAVLGNMFVNLTISSGGDAQFHDITAARAGNSGTYYFGSRKASYFDGPNESGAFRFNTDFNGPAETGHYDMEAYNLPRRFNVIGSNSDTGGGHTSWIAPINSVLFSGAANTFAQWQTLGTILGAGFITSGTVSYGTGVSTHPISYLHTYPSNPVVVAVPSSSADNVGVVSQTTTGFTLECSTGGAGGTAQWIAIGL